MGGGCEGGLGHSEQVNRAMIRNPLALRTAEHELPLNSGHEGKAAMRICMASAGRSSPDTKQQWW